MRYIDFRHDSDAGHAAAAPGFLTKRPGICLTVSAPGFINGLVALANATTNCLSDGSDFEVERASTSVVLPAVTSAGSGSRNSGTTGFPDQGGDIPDEWVSGMTISAMV